MKIEYINFPFAYTDDGKQIPVMEINGHPKVGHELILSENSSATRRYKISAITNDSECVNGVCPVK